jgi:hypothetical protein
MLSERARAALLRSDCFESMSKASSESPGVSPESPGVASESPGASSESPGVVSDLACHSESGHRSAVWVPHGPPECRATGPGRLPVSHVNRGVPLARSSESGRHPSPDPPPT